MRAKSLVFVVAALISSAALEAEPPAFRGYISAAGQMRFLVVDETHPAGRWIALGERVSGYVVESFDARHDLLTVVRNQQRTILPLTRGASRLAPSARSSLFPSMLDTARELARDGDELLARTLALMGEAEQAARSDPAAAPRVAALHARIEAIAAERTALAQHARPARR